ncbi:MAG: metal ABC transporter ATP-binding protein [Spirochaetales bacterium]|jgi:ABC-type Mn2+/Zn2+ transport system ATPase subunit|nr:metal ABC transporter ATP-binding protein [Spirochaetales bacterium]
MNLVSGSPASSADSSLISPRVRPVISVKNLYAGYGELTVLKDINLAIEAGSFTGLSGPNGAGKSTFLKICLGLLRPQKGEIQVLGGLPGTRAFRRLLPRIGYVPQNTEAGSLPATVEEVVAMGRYGKPGFCRRLGARDRLLVEAALEAAGIQELARRGVQQLSGGQKRRVAIARALAREPELLLLDEPTANIDTEGRAEILRVLKSHPEYRAMTTILVSHSAEILAECRSVYRFAGGETRA